MIDALLAAMSPLELTATLFGLASVWLTGRQNIWCWPTGLVMVSLYIVIFFEARLYSDMGLQVVYVFMQLYGWHNWLHGGQERSELSVCRLGRRRALVWGLTIAAGTAALGTTMATLTDADLPYWDAATTVASLVAQWLMAKKVLESWAIWIAVDVVSVGVYGVKGLVLTCGLYAVFLVLASLGLRSWWRSLAPDAA